MASHAVDVVPDTTILVSVGLSYALNRYVRTASIIPAPARSLGWIVIGLGIVLGLYTISLVRAHNATSRVTTVPPALLTRWPYSFSRNPFYFSYFVITIGVAMMLGSIAAFAGPLFCLAVLQAVILFEERRLAATFGEQYRRYRQAVHRWL